MLDIAARFHHVGIATSDLTSASEYVRRTFSIEETLGPVRDSNLNADVILMRTMCGLGIELVAGEVVSRILKRGGNIYHTCFEVPDLEAAIVQMRRTGALVVIGPTPAVLFNGRKVAFTHTPIGLIELLETT